jgi:membrane protein
VGAALAYYSVFSLAPILVIAIAIGGAIFGVEAARGSVVAQFQGLLGREGSMMIQTAIESSSLQPGKSLVATLLALATLLFGATGAFAELRRALNQIWRVEPTPSGFLQLLRVRLLSFGMVVMVGFLLLVSLILAACIAALNSIFTESPSWLQPLLGAIQLASSLVVESLLFAAIFKVLPDTHLRWRDVLLGGFVTAVLFELGKSVIGLYLGNAGVGSMYGAAGSLVVLLVWVYYSSQIVFVGAELTRAWTLAREGGATERRRRGTNEGSSRASRADRKDIISPVLHGGPSPQPPGAGAGREFN